MAAPLALDDGWSWVVLACRFLSLLLGYGSPQSVGILQSEWLLAFGEGKATTAWCVWWGGGVMVAGGLMLSAFAPNVSFLVFLYGVVVLAGCGRCKLAVEGVTQCGRCKLAICSCLCYSGTSVGGVLYAPLQSELIQLFRLDGCLLVVGASALNVVACAGPMRPLNLPGYFLRQRAAILERAEEEQEPSVKDPAVSMVSKKLQTLLSVSEPAFMKKKEHHNVNSLHRHVPRCYDTPPTRPGGNAPVQLFQEDLSEDIASISLVSLYSIRGGVNSVLLYAGTVGVSGLAVLLLPFGSSYLELHALALVLGFMTEAHGIFMFFGGVGLSLGPPVVGNDGLDLVSVLAGGKPRPLPRHRPTTPPCCGWDVGQTQQNHLGLSLCCFVSRLDL
uniref:Uncharacterized protein n=1 Tax=Mola mola TaxID=94237 RepID=A0A3Q3W6X2_MOLML